MLRELFPLYSEESPHTATLSGMLTMFTFFLPTTAADRTYKSLEKERMKIVETEPELAVMMIID